MTGAPPGVELLAGPSWLVQRIGRSWYVRVDFEGQAHWSEPYASREVAEDKLAGVREAYVAHMRSCGYATVTVDATKSGGDA